MTTPREHDGPYGRDPYERGRSGRHPDGEGTAAWGRPPAGGWGAPAEPGGRGTGGGYERGTPGPYDSGPEYGWQQPEYRATRGYEVEQYEPSWGQGLAPSTSRRGPRRRRRSPWIALAVVAAVIVVAILVLGFVVPGWFVTRVLSASGVQAGVAKILTDSYGVEGVADVRCPDRVQVTVGATFTCDATIDGDPVKVPIRVTDDDGGYEVGRPT
jgi:Domain of unknown function (DUF4333)